VARLVRVAVHPLEPGETLLDVPASRYLVKVHRFEPGAEFLAFDPEARSEADAILLEARIDGARCRIGAPRPAERVSRHQTGLIQCLGKGDKIDHVIRDATALGVSRLWIATSERAVVRISDEGPHRLERWRRIAIDAARQSGRGDLPELIGPIELGAAIEGAAAAWKLCLDPRAEITLYGALERAAESDAIDLLIGPEGGLSADELALADGAGFVRVSFGPFTLRTETAATAVLGAVLARRLSV
jgi:16S rRNA (uracil1498-N3)-methyltransferase